jgi:hypothetical protein
MKRLLSHEEAALVIPPVGLLQQVLFKKNTLRACMRLLLRDWLECLRPQGQAP